jgi:hypothetical protein
MAHVLEPHLRLVGGNTALTPMRRAGAYPQWPPIRIAASNGVLVGFREPVRGECLTSTKRGIWERISAFGWGVNVGVGNGGLRFAPNGLRKICGTLSRAVLN